MTVLVFKIILVEMRNIFRKINVNGYNFISYEERKLGEFNGAWLGMRESYLRHVGPNSSLRFGRPIQKFRRYLSTPGTVLSWETYSAPWKLSIPHRKGSFKMQSPTQMMNVDSEVTFIRGLLIEAY